MTSGTPSAWAQTTTASCKQDIFTRGTLRPGRVFVAYLRRPAAKNHTAVGHASVNHGLGDRWGGECQ